MLPPTDMMSKVFEPKSHQAFERRAKNDMVVDHITKKFQDSGKKNHPDAVDIKDTAVEKAEAERAARNAVRKEKEMQMKQVLDAQVARHQNSKAADREDKERINAQIQKDVASYEAEQARRAAELLEKRKKHQNEVTRQIEDRRRLMEHIGSQVVVNK